MVAPAVATANAARASLAVAIEWSDELQLAKHALVPLAESTFGDRFTVVTFNELNQVVVKLIEPTPADTATVDQLAATAGAILEGKVLVEPAHYTLRQMAAIMSRARAIIATPERAAGWSLDVDEVGEVVRIKGPREVLDSIAADIPDLGMPVVYAEAPAAHPDACHGAQLPPGNNRCDRPIRGGVWMEGCTAGFVVRSNSDHKPYILTAGHCVAEPIRQDGYKNAWDANMVAHPIGKGHNTSYFHNASHPAMNGDAGIVYIEKSGAVAGEWGPLHAWVMVRTGTSQADAKPDPVDDFDYNRLGPGAAFSVLRRSSV